MAKRGRKPKKEKDGEIGEKILNHDPALNGGSDLKISLDNKINKYKTIKIDFTQLKKIDEILNEEYTNDWKYIQTFDIGGNMYNILFEKRLVK